MPDVRILTYSLIGLGFGIYLFVSGFRWFREKRLIENMPTSKIRSIAMGMVEIFGEAFPQKGKALKSPFSNNDCVYYRYTIEEYRSSGKSSKWVIVKKGESRTYFYLKDETGSVLIDPKGAKIDIPKDFEFNSSLGKDPPDKIKSFLKSNGVGFEGLFGMNKTMRYIEHFIAPRDKVYIMGTAGDNPFVEEGSSQRNEMDIMMQKGKDFYYISDKPEKDVLKLYGWWVIGGLFGGSALIVGCLFVIFAYIGIL
ncbi:hypothetical protein J4209_00065 [Candidatus Woesearchaeota archaeon]|nr:hypothetical protein [Candidatus Woesearchaeota archaeon]